MYATLFVAGRCARIAREEVVFDPLDLSLFPEFTRFGLRTATLWVVGGSLVALFFLNWGFNVDFVATLPGWPFDVSTSLRSLLLLAVAMVSWLGGALVERLLGAALD